ncbi:MAG: histone H1 [Bacteroidales bacterium]
MKELIEKIRVEMESFSKDADSQLLKGNKTAGTRARKSALEISKMMKEFRKVSIDVSKQ